MPSGYWVTEKREDVEESNREFTHIMASICVNARAVACFVFLKANHKSVTNADVGTKFHDKRVEILKVNP